MSGSPKLVCGLEWRGQSYLQHPAAWLMRPVQRPATGTPRMGLADIALAYLPRAIDR